MSEVPPINLCDFLRFLSRNVWRRIAFSRKTNLSIRETTITEDLLYNFYQYFEAYRVPLRLFESREEYRNGSDIEVLIKTDMGFILLACQAKITYKSGNYKAFHHFVGGARQIDLLRDYANSHGGIAHYLFYNFIPEYMYSDEVETIADIDHHGITCINSDDIIDWMGIYEASGRKSPPPHFNTFHPTQAKPFHELICDLLHDGKAHLKHFPKKPNTPVTYYDEDEVYDEESWRRVTSLGQIGYINEAETIPEWDEELTTQSKTKEKQKSPPTFKPKFRVVIGGRNSGGPIQLLKFS